MKIKSIEKKSVDQSIRFYHGTDQELENLKENSYVSRNFKDACKFGYRRAVLAGKPFVYIYYIEINSENMEKFLKKDENRDRAYLTIVPIDVNLKDRYQTYQTPYKLKKFKFEDNI